jgi:PPOX class probable F420-dependent enzyme
VWDHRVMLHPKTRDLTAGTNFAVLTTLMPDGTPQSHVMWVDADEEHIYINTEIHRQKFKNIDRDPRATVTVIDRTDPYSFVEVRGTVVETIGGREARDHIDALSWRYRGKPYSNTITSERVILKIRPDREIVR